MAITVQEAVKELKSMFPTVDEEVIRMVLQENRNKMQKTLDALLMLTSSAEIVTVVSTPPTPSSVPSESLLGPVVPTPGVNPPIGTQTTTTTTDVTTTTVTSTSATSSTTTASSTYATTTSLTSITDDVSPLPVTALTPSPPPQAESPKQTQSEKEAVAPTPTTTKPEQLLEDELLARSLAVSENDDTKLVHELFRIQQDEELARQLQNAETEAGLEGYTYEAQIEAQEERRRRRRQEKIRKLQEKKELERKKEVAQQNAAAPGDSAEKGTTIGDDVKSSWNSFSNMVGDWWKTVTEPAPEAKAEEETGLLDAHDENLLVRRRKSSKDVPVLKINTA